MRVSVLQTCCQLVMKCKRSGSACPSSSQRHFEAVTPPSILQHTIAFSSRKLLLLSIGHTLHTCEQQCQNRQRQDTGFQVASPSANSILQHTNSFSSSKLLLLSMGHTLHTYNIMQGSRQLIILLQNFASSRRELHDHIMHSCIVLVWCARRYCSKTLCTAP